MGKYCKDNYAGTYAAKNVKQALDKLIDVLQSPEQVRRLVIGQGPKKPIKPSKIAFETPAMTPLWMETSASMAKKSSNLDSEKGSTPSSSDDPSDRRKTSSSRSSSRCSDSSRHISIARYHQVTKPFRFTCARTPSENMVDFKIEPSFCYQYLLYFLMV
ncbi:hypothetical protein M758_8G056600 [Ceratodon purpureus]|nr:hypothetical protein M758_8G056600 [Ceratodon purpureus]